jgi:Stabilization of polarity axis
VPFALHPHLTTAGAYTHPILVLINAVLTQKRIIFLGHNRPSGEVAHAVLAACALASGGVLRGFTRHAFPYTDLSKIDDLLNVPGFIAGVTNPTFGNHPEWWDLLCDLPTGRMKISSKIEPVSMTDGITFFQQQHPTYAPSNTGALPPATTQAPSNSAGPADPTWDIAFMDDVQRSITARHGETALRSKFREYVIKFTRIAAAFEETVFGASALHAGAVEADAGAFGVAGHGYVWPDETSKARELAANAWRIEGWRTTRAYYALIQDLAAVWGRRPIRAIDVAHQLDRLRTLKLPREESSRILIALRSSITGYAGVCQLLAAAPEHFAGLFYLGLGLWHPDRAAREATAELLVRVKKHPAGKHAWRALGRFQHAACARVLRDTEDPKKDERGGGRESGKTQHGGLGLGGISSVMDGPRVRRS